jgi:hypothetical protein
MSARAAGQRQRIAAIGSPDITLREAGQTSWGDTGIRVALVSAIATIIGAVVAVAGTISTHDTPEPESGYCATVTSKYKDLVQGRPGDAVVITAKGSNGKSIVESDESAVKCGLTNERVIELSKVSK